LINSSMLLQTKVIVSGVTNLHDARYCAGMGVENIAFPIDAKLGKHVGLAAWKEITEWLSGPSFGVELSSVENVDVDQFQADFFLTAQSELIEKYDAPFILKLERYQDAVTLIPKLAGKVEAFLLEFSDKKLEDVWTEVQAWASNYSVYVGFGITPENVGKIIDEIKPLGIGLKGGTEIKVGLNDFDGLADVLEAIEVF